MTESFAIFICHKCRKATKEVLNFKNVDIHSHKINEAFKAWQKLHEGHHAFFLPDDNGQFRPTDYDFDRHTMRLRNWW